MKTAAFKTFGPHCKAVTVPVYDADTIAPLREEDLEEALEWILGKRVAYQRDQAIGTFAPVHGLRGHEHANTRRKTQHCQPYSSTCRRRRKADAPTDSAKNSR